MNDAPAWCSEHMEPYCPRHSAGNDATCQHGIPLVSRVGGPSAYCEDCTDAFMANPRYYADNLHLPSHIPPAANQGASDV